VAGRLGKGEHVTWARVQAVIAPVIVLALFLWLWQQKVFNDLLDLKTFTLPLPSDIVDSFQESGKELRESTWETLKPALLGYLLGNGLGFLLGALLLALPAARAVRVSSGFTAVQALPIIAIAPIVSLYVTSDTGFKAVTVMIMIFPSMMIYSYRGLTSLDGRALDLMASYGASRTQTFRKLRFPSSLPFVFTSLKYSTVLALIGVIVCEVLKSRTGLGYLITDAFQGFRTPDAWAAVVILAVAGIVSYSLLGLVERVLFPWSVKRGSTR
jgi:NitT/TauT family transport system permease protein